MIVKDNDGVAREIGDGFMGEARITHRNLRIAHVDVKPSNTEYDNFSGYVTGNYVSEWYDRRGTKWRSIVTVINLGRPDRGIAVDPDEQLDSEPFDDIPERIAAAIEGKRRAKQERDEVLMEQMQQLFTKHGPMSAPKIATILGGNNGMRLRILDVLRANRDRFVFLGGQFAVWGNPGQEYVPPPRVRRITRTMQDIRDALMERGPQGTNELAKALGISQMTVQSCVAKNPEWFCVVRVRPAKGNPEAKIWGVVGIHDREAA